MEGRYRNAEFGITKSRAEGRTQLSKILIPEKKKAAHGDMSRLGGEAS
jgi:hypothetical protein